MEMLLVILQTIIASADGSVVAIGAHLDDDYGNGSGHVVSIKMSITFGQR